jgi:hypothetical protein
MCENAVRGIQDFLAVPQYSQNEQIWIVLDSRPQFTRNLEVASIAFVDKIHHLKIGVNCLKIANRCFCHLQVVSL